MGRHLLRGEEAADEIYSFNWTTGQEYAGVNVNDMVAMPAAMAAPLPEMAAAIEKHGVIPALSLNTEK